MAIPERDGEGKTERSERPARRACGPPRAAGGRLDGRLRVIPRREAVRVIRRHDGIVRTDESVPGVGALRPKWGRGSSRTR